MTRQFVFAVVPHHTLFGGARLQDGYVALLLNTHLERYERGESVPHPTEQPLDSAAICFPDRQSLLLFRRYIDKVLEHFDAEQEASPHDEG